MKNRSTLYERVFVMFILGIVRPLSQSVMLMNVKRSGIATVATVVAVTGRMVSTKFTVAII